VEGLIHDAVGAAAARVRFLPSDDNVTCDFLIRALLFLGVGLDEDPMDVVEESDRQLVQYTPELRESIDQTPMGRVAPFFLGTYKTQSKLNEEPDLVKKDMDEPIRSLLNKPTVCRRTYGALSTIWAKKGFVDERDLPNLRGPLHNLGQKGICRREGPFTQFVRPFCRILFSGQGRGCIVADPKVRHYGQHG
jgi:hypothetical protein